MEAIHLRLPGYGCTFRVTGFERARNNGPMLTLALAEGQRDGGEHWRKFGDIVTRMRLADLLSDQHELPINNVKLYGPRGRGVMVGRKGAQS